MENISEQVSFHNTEDDLKILLRILSIYLVLPEIVATISSLINLRDHPVYTWSRVYTFQIRSASDSRVVRQSSIEFTQAQFNPHLPSGFSFRTTRDHRLPGVTVHEHRIVTIQGIFRGPVVRRGGVIYIYRGQGLWYRFRSGVLVEQEREVES